jgi:hypothetical protein
MKGQVVHMLVHHNQVPWTSSIVVALIVGLSAALVTRKIDIIGKLI